MAKDVILKIKVTTLADLEWERNVEDLEDYQEAADNDQWTCDCGQFTGTPEEVDRHIRESNKDIDFFSNDIARVVCWGRTRERL